jgi:hypothetical protein
LSSASICTGGIAPVERRVGGERGREEIGKRDDDLVGIPFRFLDVEEALRARAAGLVDHHHGLLHQLVLRDQTLAEARHLVGAASGTGRNDELDRFGGFPGRQYLLGQYAHRYGRQQWNAPAQSSININSHDTPPLPKSSEKQVIVPQKRARSTLSWMPELLRGKTPGNLD